MNKQDIIGAILSKDVGRVAEAKAAIKTMLNDRATLFRYDSSKFVTKSLFEGSDTSIDQAKVSDHKAQFDNHMTLSKKHTDKSEHDIADLHLNAASAHTTAGSYHASNHPEKNSKSIEAMYASNKVHKASKE